MTKKLFSATALAALAFSAVSAFADVPVLNDGQISQIIRVADRAQVNAGLAAHEQAMNTEVKDYADNSVKVFTSNIAQLKKLEISAGITAEESEASKALQDETDKTLQNLKSLKGVGFDKAYIDNQVEMLQRYMDSLDQALIPQAQNADLKTFLQSSRSGLDAEMNAAKALQAALNTPTPPAPNP